MKLLVIVPDYLSHYLPLGEVMEAWRRSVGAVAVATGPGMAARASSAGFETHELVLGRGHNSGIASAAEQPGDEAGRLAAFLSVTREGPIPTLLFQAEQRRHDLLWRPLEVADRLERIIWEAQPDVILADQLAFAATLALRARGRGYASFVTGHPTAVPAADEVYGVPPMFPSAIKVDDQQLAGLRRRALSVSAAFTAAYGDALTTLDPTVSVPRDAFAATGTTTLFNYPEALHAGSGRALPARSTFLGAVARAESLPDDLDALLPMARTRPRVYVSLGTFLSSRDDLLRIIVDGLRSAPVDVVMAIGAVDRSVFGVVPDRWIIRPSLPQVAILDRCDIVVTHGGNNTVTESLRAGLPLLVLPLSTDQFAGAADIERAGLGSALDARHLTPEQVRESVDRVGTGETAARAASLGRKLRAAPGADIAVARLLALARTAPLGRLTPPDRAPAMRS